MQLADYQTGTPIYSGDPTAVPNGDGTVTPISNAPGVPDAIMAQGVQQYVQGGQAPQEGLSSLLGYAPVVGAPEPQGYTPGQALPDMDLSSILGYAPVAGSPMPQTAPQPQNYGYQPQHQPQQQPTPSPYAPDQFMLREAGYLDAMRQLKAENEVLRNVGGVSPSGMRESNLGGGLGTAQASPPTQTSSAPTFSGADQTQAVAEALEALGVVPAMQAIAKELEGFRSRESMNLINQQIERLKRAYGEEFDPIAMAQYGIQNGLTDMEKAFYHWRGRRMPAGPPAQHQGYAPAPQVMAYSAPAPQPQQGQYQPQPQQPQYQPQQPQPYQGQALPRHMMGPVTTPVARQPAGRGLTSVPKDYNEAQSIANRLMGLPA